MDIERYIESGILELYVYGTLSEKENVEVARVIKNYPEIQEEIEKIEAALLNISAATAPHNPQFLINSLRSKIYARGGTNTAPAKKRSSLPSYIGWAASILLLVGLFFMFNKNRDLRKSLQALQAERAMMESQIAETRDDNEKIQELLEIFRNRNIIKVPLPGQDIAPNAYAAAWWDRSNNFTYIDAQNLPEPPQGLVYQVWSLKLQPLTPTSIGLLEKFEEDKNKIFALENPNDSEGFGITLEPEGGSETPTMEQLYALGTLSS